MGTLRRFILYFPICCVSVVSISCKNEKLEAQQHQEDFKPQEVVNEVVEIENPAPVIVPPPAVPVFEPPARLATGSQGALKPAATGNSDDDSNNSSESCTTDPNICDDNNECTDDECEEGVCRHTNNENECVGQNPCTSNDICEDGVCVEGPENCNDNFACTTDSCGPLGCVNTNTCPPPQTCIGQLLCNLTGGSYDAITGCCTPLPGP